MPTPAARIAAVRHGFRLKADHRTAGPDLDILLPASKVVVAAAPDRRCPRRTEMQAARSMASLRLADRPVCSWRASRRVVGSCAGAPGSLVGRVRNSSDSRAWSSRWRSAVHPQTAHLSWALFLIRLAPVSASMPGGRHLRRPGAAAGGRDSYRRHAVRDGQSGAWDRPADRGDEWLPGQPVRIALRRGSGPRPQCRLDPGYCLGTARL